MIAARLPFWTQLGSFWGDSGSIFNRFWHHVWRVKNIEKLLVLFSVCYFWSAGKVWLRHLGGCLRRCCLKDPIFLASWRHLETMLRHVGAKMAIKSAKMSQHRRNWCPRGTHLGAMDALKGGCGAFKSRKKPITTTKVEQSPAGPLHALRAEGTVADIYPMRCAHQAATCLKLEAGMP